MNLYIDGMSVVMRPAMVATSFDGSPATPIEAANIALGMTQRWIRQLRPDRVIWAFDHPDPNWREFVYPAYKQHRTTNTTPYGVAMMELVPPEHDVWQIAGYEADDIIATLVVRDVEPAGILTADSDYFQLVSDRVKVVRPAKHGKLDVWDVTRVCEHHGLDHPAQYIDWKALVGDKSDGIPGVPGVGPKRAAKLLEQHGTLLKCVQAGALGDEAQNALLWQSLIRLRQDVKACINIQPT
jgi:DNA polymerase-1